MPGSTLASQTMYLNFVNLLACIYLASAWLKNNQLLSELTQAHYREPVPLRFSEAEFVTSLIFKRFLSNIWSRAREN